MLTVGDIVWATDDWLDTLAFLASRLLRGSRN